MHVRARVRSPDRTQQIAALDKPAFQLPLGQNKGALIRRQKLSGKATLAAGATRPMNYKQLTATYKFPAIGAWSDCQLLPDNVQIGINLTLNDL